MAKSLHLTVNIPEHMFHDRESYRRFCWETYGRYLDDKTKATIIINITPAKK